MLELIINKEETKKNIMLLENGTLIEKHEEHENQKRIEGNIYVGLIQNVLQGMQAAFVDIGEERNTFIRLKDLLPKIDEKENKKNDNNEETNIKDVAKQGMKVLIQVKRDGSAKKGARVSTHINLPRKICCFYAKYRFYNFLTKNNR